MRHMRNGFSKVPRVLVLCLMTLLLILTLVVPLTALAAEDGVSDLSLYQRASELTREFGTALAPGSGEDRLYMLESTNSENLLVPGNAGAFLGYADVMADDTGIVGWLMNSYTAASATISYDQLMHVVDIGVGAGASEQEIVKAASVKNPFFQYAGYGEVLTDMGLITTMRTSTGSLPRIIATGLVLVAYLLANVAPFLFRGALMILTTLNPFQLFGSALSGVSNADLGMISGIADYLSEIYETVQNFSMFVLLPMLLALTVLSILMISKGSVLQKFSRYALRVFMIFAGLPLIGATYTGAIENLDQQVSVGSEYADYLVLSSYVDFENWVKYSRLAPPVESNIMNPRFSEDADRSLSDRGLILEINGTRAAIDRAYVLEDRYNSTSDMSKIFTEGGATKDVSEGPRSVEQESSFKSIFTLLTRHMSSAQYTSSDYNGEVSGQIQRIRSANSSSENDENIVKMFSLSSSSSRTWQQTLNPVDWGEDWQKAIHWNGDGKEEDSAKGLFTEGDAANELFQFGIYDMNIYNAGDLRYVGGSGYESPAMPVVVKTKTAPIGPDRASTVGGLSPIAMYNFLNTSFSSTGLTVYSPDKTLSDTSRDAYASVTFGGTGVAAWTRWVENLTVMLSLATLSIAFGLMMVSVALTNIPRILSGVFGTALGSIAFITKLLISTAVLLIQIIGMVFMYTLSENIIMTMLLNFNELVDTGGSYFGAGIIFEFLGSFMVIAVTVAVTWFMIKNVKVFKEMMEEVVSNSINRLMGALDTNTGGRGLDTAQTTGGRMGSNGKLSDAANAADDKGLGGLLGKMQPGALAGGVAGLLGAAHDVEARREQAMQELDPNAPKKSLKDKIGSRYQTAKDLGGARMKDAGKGAFGVDGKSYEREAQAKDQSIRAMAIRGQEGLADSKQSKVNGGDDDVAVPATSQGQRMDEDGNVIRDENGNAIDAKGNPISADTGLGVMAGQRPQVGKDGSVLDAEGNAYTDEMGNVFRQDEKGRLVDENGQYMALDKDGTLQPIASIPGHNGKPVSATGEAAKLDGQRFDANKYGEMKDAQTAAHHGLDKNGNVIGADGNEMFAKTPNGNVPVTTDRNGFVTDKDGNKVAASNVIGAVDSRGFEEVVDSATGETHLKHKGDEAMKSLGVIPAVMKNGKQTPQNLTEMAKQSNKADNVAKRANEHVADLKKNGASPYAISQAERFANQANKNAKQMQNRFNGAMQEQGKNPQASSSQSQKVTPEQVTSAVRHASNVKATLGAQESKLSEMKASGAPANIINRQERKVDAGRTAALQAVNVAKDTETASKTGRSFNEINQARDKADRAEQVFNKAQQSLDTAVANGAPPAEVQKRKQALDTASSALSTASSNMARVQQAPSGSRSEIDRATAVHSQAQQQHAQAESRVKELAYKGSPQAVNEAKAEAQRAQTVVSQERQAKQKADMVLQQLQQSGAPNSQIQGAKRDAETASRRTQEAQTQHARALTQVEDVVSQKPLPQEIKQAKKEQVMAKRTLHKAQQVKQNVNNPKGWTQNATPTVQPVPKASPTKSFAELTSSGINNYGDYKSRVSESAAAVKTNQLEVQQAKQRLAAMRTSNRPPQVVKQAEQHVQALQQQAQNSQVQLDSLRGNAQGLLKNGKFQPMIASRPIRKNGGMIVNQMVNMGHTQAMLDKLSYQEKSGMLTDAGRLQMKTLSGKLSHMRRGLVSAGIREDKLQDSVGISEATKHMQQSWDAFINGTSSEGE